MMTEAMETPCSGCALAKVAQRFFETNDIDTLIFGFCNRRAYLNQCIYWPEPKALDEQDGTEQSTYTDDFDLPF